MRLKEKSLGFIVNFLLGVAWASVFIGTITSFLTFYNSSFFTAVIYAFIGAVPGLVAVLMLEYIIVSNEKYEELKKQTKLLEELLKQNK
jgi:uncharacterized membrane protein YeaQ/YmgE (transglycosylase-associated protein family)